MPALQSVGKRFQRPEHHRNASLRDQVNKKIMNNLLRTSLQIGVIFVLSTAVFAQQAKRTPFDVTNYVIDAALVPVENKLVATADVTFVPQEDTRTVAFELNGSLKVDEITRIGSSTPAPVAGGKGRTPKTVPTTAAVGSVTFVQDQAGGSSDLGPHVRVDLGTDVSKGTPVTLRFKYNGILNLPSGGPLLNKRLAYIGENQGYLMYAARWFPFHDYAAGRSDADIAISLPGGYQVAGYSSQRVMNAGNRYRFVQSGLVGNIGYGKYATRTLNVGGYEL